jgi:hypothetical protein
MTEQSTPNQNVPTMWDSFTLSHYLSLINGTIENLEAGDTLATHKQTNAHTKTSKPRHTALVPENQKRGRPRKADSSGDLGTIEVMKSRTLQFLLNSNTDMLPETQGPTTPGPKSISIP